eukprot:1040946-Pleurochrysis_carterae.AAC.1
MGASGPLRLTSSLEELLSYLILSFRGVIAIVVTSAERDDQLGVTVQRAWPAPWTTTHVAARRIAYERRRE